MRPSAVAVLRFMISSNAVACRTGRSAGFVPLGIWPAYVPCTRVAIGAAETGAVGDGSDGHGGSLDREVPIVEHKLDGDFAP